MFYENAIPLFREAMPRDLIGACEDYQLHEVLLIFIYSMSASVLLSILQVTLWFLMLQSSERKGENRVIPSYYVAKAASA